jgi:hypothetical protein
LLLTVLHGIEGAAWALAYVKLGALPDLPFRLLTCPPIHTIAIVKIDLDLLHPKEGTGLSLVKGGLGRDATVLILVCALRAMTVAVAVL